jgi:hypothetical protein
MKRIFIIIMILFGFSLISVAFAQEKSVKKFDYRDFSKINASGMWKINLVKGDSYKTTVFSSRKAGEYIELKKKGNVLYLKNNTLSWVWGKWFSKSSNDEVYAEIMIPHLDKIETSGSVEVFFKGFMTDFFNIETSGNSKVVSQNNKILNLFIDVSGNSVISGYDCKIDNLSVEASGNTDLDFDASTITNANLYLNGSSKAKIKMDGGHLSGRIGGNSSVSYRGKVISQDISVFGAGTVTKKK